MCVFGLRVCLFLALVRFWFSCVFGLCERDGFCVCLLGSCIWFVRVICVCVCFALCEGLVCLVSGLCLVCGVYVWFVYLYLICKSRFVVVVCAWVARVCVCVWFVWFVRSLVCMRVFGLCVWSACVFGLCVCLLVSLCVPGLCVLVCVREVRSLTEGRVSKVERPPMVLPCECLVSVRMFTSHMRVRFVWFACLVLCVLALFVLFVLRVCFVGLCLIVCMQVCSFCGWFVRLICGLWFVVRVCVCSVRVFGLYVSGLCVRAWFYACLVCLRLIFFFGWRAWRVCLVCVWFCMFCLGVSGVLCARARVPGLVGAWVFGLCVWFVCVWFARASFACAYFFLFLCAWFVFCVWLYLVCVCVLLCIYVLGLYVCLVCVCVLLCMRAWLVCVWFARV